MIRRLPCSPCPCCWPPAHHANRTPTRPSITLGSGYSPGAGADLRAGGDAGGGCRHRAGGELPAIPAIHLLQARLLAGLDGCRKPMAGPGALHGAVPAAPISRCWMPTWPNRIGESALIRDGQRLAQLQSDPPSGGVRQGAAPASDCRQCPKPLVSCVGQEGDRPGSTNCRPIAAASLPAS